MSIALILRDLQKALTQKEIIMDESLRIYLNYLLTVRVTFGTLTLISMLVHIANMVS